MKYMYMYLYRCNSPTILVQAFGDDLFMHHNNYDLPVQAKLAYLLMDRSVVVVFEHMVLKPVSVGYRRCGSWTILASAHSLRKALHTAGIGNVHCTRHVSVCGVL